MVDNRVKVPHTGVKMKHHRALCAVARYLKVKETATTREILDHATFRNGKYIKHRLKSIHQLASLLRVHPHFDKMMIGQFSTWFISNPKTYLLGEGQAYPPEYYKETAGIQNKKGVAIKKVIE